MMKSCLLLGSIISASLFSSIALAENWQPQQGAMLTQWGEKVTPENVWQAYPRPQMVRQNWQNLNGLWQFKTQEKNAPAPQSYNQQILVPFVMESPLSGIGKRLAETDVIWYQKEFEYTPHSGRSLLNFEGCDFNCSVWLNEKMIGQHKGGNLPFSFDVTNAIQSGTNTLVLKVIDDTDSPNTYQLRGKQKRNNKGIWYTPSSGIWHTVWLEQVPTAYIEQLKFVGDMQGELNLTAHLSGSFENNNASANNSDSNINRLRITVLDNGKIVARTADRGNQIKLKVKNAKLWSPNSPHLYDLTVELLNDNGQVLDTVSSYVGFRSIGKQQDEKGHWRFTLNDEEIFHWGPLDQGWWPDGLLTPPSEAAYLHEMKYLKQAGFNMIRKHKKVEPRRYYYQADKLGFLVWQDHVSGGAGGDEWPKWKRLEFLNGHVKPNPEKKGHWQKPGDPIDAVWPDWAHEQYMTELKTMIDTLHNHPSIVMWTTFNERWGQHRSMEVGQWTAEYDPTRYLNIASGGNFFPIGDIADQHKYPDPSYPFAIPLYDDYIKVVGEFGGHGWPVEGHQWQTNTKKWGYGGLPKTIDEFQSRYKKSIKILSDLKQKGVAAGVYTQTTDVEIEINGLMTYDRKVNKISTDELSKIHDQHKLVD